MHRRGTAGGSLLLDLAPRALSDDVGFGFVGPQVLEARAKADFCKTSRSGVHAVLFCCVSMYRMHRK